MIKDSLQPSLRDSLNWSLRPFSSAAPAAWSPLDLSNLLTWISADAVNYKDIARTTPVTTDLDTVGSATDLSGNNNHWEQATEASRPTYRTGIFGSLPAFLFDMSDDYMSLNSQAATLSGTDTPFSVAYVIQPNNLTNRTIWSTGNASSNISFQRHALIATTTNQFYKRDTGFGEALNTGGTTSTALHYFVHAHTGTNLTVWQDGTKIINNEASDVAAMSVNLLTLGALRRLSSSEPYGGYIAEFLITTGVIGDADAGELNTYFSDKWS